MPFVQGGGFRTREREYIREGAGGERAGEREMERESKMGATALSLLLLYSCTSIHHLISVDRPRDLWFVHLPVPGLLGTYAYSRSSRA